MFTLITTDNEYKFDTIEELTDKANELAIAAGQRTSFDLEYSEKDVYFGFNSEGHLTAETVKEWIREEVKE